MSAHPKAGTTVDEKCWTLDKPMVSLSTCHLHLCFGWQILLNLVKITTCGGQSPSSAPSMSPSCYNYQQVASHVHPLDVARLATAPCSVINPPLVVPPPPPCQRTVPAQPILTSSQHWQPPNSLVSCVPVTRNVLPSQFVLLIPKNA